MSLAKCLPPKPESWTASDGILLVTDGLRLVRIGALPSIGSVGDSFENALAEPVNGHYKARLVWGPDHPEPWKTVEQLELAALGLVH